MQISTTYSIEKPTLASDSVDGSLAASNTAVIDKASLKCLLRYVERAGQSTPVLAFILRYIKGDWV